MVRGDPGRCRADVIGRTARPVDHGRRRDADRQCDRDGGKCGEKHPSALVTDLEGGDGFGLKCFLHGHIIERAALASLSDRLGRRLASARRAAGRPERSVLQLKGFLNQAFYEGVAAPLVARFPMVGPASLVHVRSNSRSRVPRAISRHVGGEGALVGPSVSPSGILAEFDDPGAETGQEKNKADGGSQQEARVCVRADVGVDDLFDDDVHVFMVMAP